MVGLVAKRFLPIKSHFFFFFACTSPILPFMMVIVKQMGISVMVQGIIGSVILIITVILKPLMATLADSLPKLRKAIFIAILVLMVSSLFSIHYLPPMHGIQTRNISGRIFVPRSSSVVSRNLNKHLHFQENELSYLLIVNDGGACYPYEMWDCQSIFNSSLPIKVPYISLYRNGTENVFIPSSENKSSLSYSLGKALLPSSVYHGARINFRCEGGLYEGDACPSLWSNGFFYLYFILFTVGIVMFSTANSISDAICLDIVGKGGDYGGQRAWGTIAWGLMGLVGGISIDWYSGDNYARNYFPAFMILFVFGSIDILLSASKLKVPRLESDEGVWSSIVVVLRQPQFATFLMFAILAGALDGVIHTFIFVFQEEMAEGTWFMQYMKFINGLTLAVQCFFEAIFMWMCDWTLKYVRSSTLMSIVFFIYIIRFFAIGLVGMYGPVWATLLTEIMNGPCYGLGYTAIVVHAGLFTPQGTSATVQSITNICYEALGYSLASLFGGILFKLVGGPRMYFIFGCIACVTFILHLISLHWDRRIEERASKRGLKLTKEEEMLTISPPTQCSEKKTPEEGTLLSEESQNPSKDIIL